jgi:exopolysaccharide production protein ExoZ
MLYWLQVLRGIAVTLVLLFHYRTFLNGAYGQNDLGDILFGNGYMGVDIFFFISGFIITYSTKNIKNGNPVDFLIRRFFRIVPLAWIATITFDWSQGFIYDWHLLVRSLLFIPAKMDGPPRYGCSLLGVVWSLSYELLFYGIFSCALAISHRFRSAIAGLFIGGLIFIYQLTFVGHITFDAHETTLRMPQIDGVTQIIGLLTNPLLFEFVIGMILAEIYIYMVNIPYKPSIYISRLASLFFFTIFLYCYFAVTPGGHGLAGKGLAALCLVMSVLLLEISEVSDAKQISRGGIWFYLGTISYSIYLIHNGVTERILWKAPFIKDYYFQNKGIPMIVSCTLVSVILASIVNRYIEGPFHQIGRRLAETHTRKRNARRVKSGPIGSPDCPPAPPASDGTGCQ